MCLSVLENVERNTGLKTSQNADEPVGDLVAFGDTTSDIFFADPGTVQVKNVAIGFLCGVQRRFFDAFSRSLRMFAKVFQQYVNPRQIAHHPFGISQRPQRPSKNHPIESRKNTEDS